MKLYYLVTVWCDVEPEIHGPFTTEEERDRKSLEIRFNTPDGDDMSMFPLDIESLTIPRAVMIGTYGAGWIEENEPKEDIT